jgi:hypothetical protein
MPLINSCRDDGMLSEREIEKDIVKEIEKEIVKIIIMAFLITISFCLLAINAFLIFSALRGIFRRLMNVFTFGNIIRVYKDKIFSALRGIFRRLMNVFTFGNMICVICMDNRVSKVSLYYN